MNTKSWIINKAYLQQVIIVLVNYNTIEINYLDVLNAHAIAKLCGFNNLEIGGNIMELLKLLSQRAFNNNAHSNITIAFLGDSITHGCFEATANGNIYIVVE